MIRRAVVPVAGYSTRLLPATKSQPKEMLPVARKPIVQYAVEELVLNAVRQVLFITGRNKTAIENHFDSDPALARLLTKGDRTGLMQEVELTELNVRFFYTRQRHQKGLGDAVLCAESFVGEEPFVVALGDSVLGLNAQSRTVSRMIELFETRRASCVVAVQEVPPEMTGRYGIVQTAEGYGDQFRVRSVVEKPDPDKAPSNLAFVGRYVFSPLVFELIRRVEPDSRGDVQLTEAIRLMCEEGKRVLALKLAPGERRFDIGNFPGYFETFVEFALADPMYGAPFRATLERLLDRQPAG